MATSIRTIRNPWLRRLAEYGIITISIFIMAVGVYFFKFPNHFSFGGVTGLSPVISCLTDCSASGFTFLANMGLLVLGFLFLGASVGIKTVYASLMLSAFLSIMEQICPLDAPLTSQPLLELCFAVLLPAIGSAILFNIGVSSGGTDIVAMILKKHTSLNIGSALFAVDALSVVLAFFVFDPETGLFSTLGLTAKSLMVDGLIENMNLCKCFTIVCDDPDPICQFIIRELHRDATVYEAQGAFTHHDKSVIMTTMRRPQALRLRNYIRRTQPGAFIMISNSSEIIGKGFLAG